MSDPRPAPAVWFPAKTYGWGWGPPRCWQGWVVVALYVLGAVSSSLVFLPKAGPVRPVCFAATLAGLTVVMIAICWWKGERPAWRWGGTKK